MSTKRSAREVAYLALLKAQEQAFISPYLEQWRVEEQPSAEEYHFAQQLAYGTMQMARALDFLAERMTAHGKLNVKTKEKLLLREALYQAYFLNKVPLYAIVNESVSLAKKYCHTRFANFLNALLRKVPEYPCTLPTDNSTNSLSIRFSYPPYFVKELVSSYGVDKAIAIMQSGNQAAQVMVRLRKETIPGLRKLNDLPVASVEDRQLLPLLANSSDYYIQNATPVHLITKLCQFVFQPSHILDLCASPGGKLLALHDAFPDAQLYANDVSEEKVRKLHENLNKYQLLAHVSCSLGQEYPIDKKFELVILDVPCSNTGVLNKRPEARWRLSEEQLKQLEATQKQLIAHAVQLMEPQGELWYMTCSILKQENEEIVSWACREYGLECRWQQTVLPNDEGWDGGYAAALIKSK